MHRLLLVRVIALVSLTAGLGCAAFQRSAPLKANDRAGEHFVGNMWCEADQCTQQINYQETVIGPARKPGTKSSDPREWQEAEAHYARAVNLIRGIVRRDAGEVSRLLESACAGGVSEACEDIEAKNLTPPKLSEWNPVRPGWEAVRHEVKGSILMKCRLPTDGVPKNCRTIYTLPWVDRPALRTIPTWRYRPAAYKGEPVEVGLVIRLRIDAQRQQ